MVSTDSVRPRGLVSTFSFFVALILLIDEEFDNGKGFEMSVVFRVADFCESGPDVDFNIEGNGIRPATEVGNFDRAIALYIRRTME